VAKHEKYLVTVDADTGEAVKIEHVGEAGELTDLPLEDFQVAQGTPSTPHQVVNVFIGSQPGEGVRVQQSRKPPPQPPAIIIGGPRPPRPKPADEDDEGDED